MARRRTSPKVSELHDTAIDQLALYSPTILQRTAEAHDMYEAAPESSKDIMALCDLIGIAGAIRHLPYEKVIAELADDYDQVGMEIGTLQNMLKEQMGSEKVADLSLAQTIRVLEEVHGTKTEEELERKMEDGGELTTHYPEFLLCPGRLPENGYNNFIDTLFKDAPSNHPHSDLPYLHELGEKLYQTLPETEEELLAHGIHPETTVTDIETPLQKQALLEEREALISELSGQLQEEVAYLEIAKPILEEKERQSEDEDISKACDNAVKLCNNVELLYGQAQSLLATIERETEESLADLIDGLPSKGGHSRN